MFEPEQIIDLGKRQPKNLRIDIIKYALPEDAVKYLRKNPKHKILWGGDAPVYFGDEVCLVTVSQTVTQSPHDIHRKTPKKKSTYKKTKK